jgi:ABC-2 type transport system permease protein
VTVGLTSIVTATVSCAPAGCGYDVPRLSLVGIQAGQASVALVAVQAISGEYGTGTIRTTLAAMPRRATLVAAKAATLIGLTLPTGTVAVIGCLLSAQLVMPGRGFAPTGRHPPPSLTDPSTLRAAGGSVLYLALIALLSPGIAATVRNGVGAMGVVLGLLYFVPVTALLVPDPRWQRTIMRISPVDAGQTIQATTHLAGLPLTPWAGLGVLTAWATGALVTAILVLRVRDA